MPVVDFVLSYDLVVKSNVRTTALFGAIGVAVTVILAWMFAILGQVDLVPGGAVHHRPWGSPACTAADVACNGGVNVADLLELIANWG